MAQDQLIGGVEFKNIVVSKRQILKFIGACDFQPFFMFDIVDVNLQRFDEAEAMLLSMVERYPERYEVYKRLAYLEADRQQVKENADRDDQKMLGYYEQAVERYTGKEQDAEMEMLEVMMQEIRDGGWL